MFCTAIFLLPKRFWSFQVIHVIAKLEIAPGLREQFLEMFHKLVPQVLAEEGCLEYGPTVDKDNSIEWAQACGENVVTVVEKWESLEALQAHLVAPHMQDFRQQASDYLRGISGHILESA